MLPARNDGGTGQRGKNTSPPRHGAKSPNQEAATAGKGGESIATKEHERTPKKDRELRFRAGELDEICED
jgi:hypothetical protein